MKRFENKAVFIAGATTGFGRLIIEQVVSEGGKVAFADITDGQFIADEYGKQGHDVIYIKADATNETDVKSSFHAAVSHFGKIDAAINNVGGRGKGDKPGIPLHESSTEGWNNGIALNGNSVFWYMREEIAHMLQHGGGVIVNTASLAGVRALPYNLAPASYTSAKAAIIHLTKYAAKQYASHNIRVNVIAPGMIATELLKSSFTPEALQNMVSATQPMGRMVEPKEIAAAYAFLCSDDAASITGIVLPVDAGMSVA